ncbi:MAG: glucose 1-dehydrogenase [Pseudomonadota bacterium]
MHRLDGRVALVTGGARGIGLAICEALAGAGAAIMLTDVLDQAGEASAQRLRDAGHQCEYRHHDVTSEADWVEVVGACEKRFGGLDTLVNNAGIFIAKPTADTTLEEFRRVQAVNVDGVFLGIKHSVPALARRAQAIPGGASIVNLSSVAALIGTPDALAYSTSKGAVRTMSKVAAVDCGRKGLKIRVNSVHPGVIQTLMGQQVFDELGSATGHDSAEIEAKMIAAHPIGRLGNPEDVANAVLFLASDASAFVTGAELVVDGGMFAS